MEFSIWAFVLHPFFDGNLAFDVLLLVLFDILFESLTILVGGQLWVWSYLDGLDLI